MNDAQRRLLRYSLVFVWLATAVVSIWEIDGQSRQLLATLPFSSPELITALVLAGAAADAVVGLWIAFWPGRAAYAVALLLMVAMTLLATAIEPGWWLHPFGPLTKNLPIAAILIVLLRDAKP